MFFRGTCRIHNQGDWNIINFHQTTWCWNPEDRDLSKSFIIHPTASGKCLTSTLQEQLTEVFKWTLHIMNQFAVMIIGHAHVLRIPCYIHHLLTGYWRHRKLLKSRNIGFECMELHLHSAIRLHVVMCNLIKYINVLKDNFTFMLTADWQIRYTSRALNIHRLSERPRQIQYSYLWLYCVNFDRKQLPD